MACCDIKSRCRPEIALTCWKYQLLTHLLDFHHLYTKLDPMSLHTPVELKLKPKCSIFWRLEVWGPFSKDLSQKDLRPKDLFQRTFDTKGPLTKRTLARGPFPKDLLNQRTFGQKDLFFKGPFVKRTFFQKDLLLKGPFWEVDAKYIVST